MTARLLLLALLAAGPAGAREPAVDAPPIPVAVPTAAEALAPLEAAYQKEHAYLAAEKEGLEYRIAAQRQEGDRRRAAAEAELVGLEARLVALQTRVEASEALLADVERAAEGARAADDALDAAWFQITSTLDDLAPPADDSLAARAEAFGRAFEAGARRVDRVGDVRATEGAFFLADGAEVSGRIIEVGDVATFGEGPGGAVALMPAGDGRLQAWRGGGGSTGDALLAGRPEAGMGLYLHEGRSERIDERPPKTVGDVIAAGGAVGLVILGLGAVAALLVVGRALTLAAAGGRRATEQALAHVDARRFEDAARALGTPKDTAGRVVAALLARLAVGRAALEDVASEALLGETPRVERFNAAILVIAAVAPLLGLLGTVTGMIATFDVITEHGTGDPRMLSGGISEALVTTMLGLTVAIPALLLGNLLSGWGATVMGRAEHAALRVLNAVADEEPEPLPAGDALRRVS